MQDTTKTSRIPTSRNGEDGLTCSQEGFRASPFLWPDEERERRMTATCGRTCYVRYMKSDPFGSLVRTLLETSRWFSPARRLRWEAKPLYSERVTLKEHRSGKNTSSRPSAVTLNVRDIPSSRLLYRLVPSARPTGGTGCGLLLPTPTAIDSGSGLINKSPSPGAKKRPTIALAAKMGLLPTPLSRDVKGGEKVTGTVKTRASGETFSARLADLAESGLLLTPCASDGKRATMTMESLKKKDKPNAENSNLAEQIAHRICGGDSRLNPLFVAEMMGFPVTWTVLPFQSGGTNL